MVRSLTLGLQGSGTVIYPTMPGLPAEDLCFFSDIFFLFLLKKIGKERKCGLGAVFCLAWGKAVPLEGVRRGYLVVSPRSIPGHGLSVRYAQQSPVTKANLPAQHPVLNNSGKASSTIKTHSHNQGFLPCVCKYGDQGERAKPRPPRTQPTEAAAHLCCRAPAAPSPSPHVPAPWLLLAPFPWSPTGLNPSLFPSPDRCMMLSAQQEDELCAGPSHQALGGV